MESLVQVFFVFANLVASKSTIQLSSIMQQAIICAKQLFAGHVVHEGSSPMKNKGKNGQMIIVFEWNWPLCFPYFSAPILFLLGRYVYIEANGPKNGDFARLTSPIISVSQKRPKCLTFWYHMYGPHVSALNVYTNTTTLGPAIWSKNRTQGNVWKVAKVDIQMSQSFSVSLQTYTGLLLMVMFIVCKLAFIE